MLALLLWFGLPCTPALDNGLARTPPMGWLSWTRFMCVTNCKRFPDACISERLFRTMADILVAEGYAAAGYVHVNLDDCWAEPRRDEGTGRIQPHHQRFSSGIPALSQYMHERGLKLGMYANYGLKTCMGQTPGSTEENLEIDARTFADWGADMLKLDGCFTPTTHMDEAYPQMGKYLNQTKRPMVYSCSWPYYQLIASEQPNYKLISRSCHLWRNFHDIQLNFESIKAIIAHYEQNQDTYIQFHGPGHWNDPDMLIVGNPELTVDQARTQMALWCIWSAPLLMSNDLRHVPPAQKAILLNRNLIAVNQDPLGIMGRMVNQKGALKIYLKRVTPTAVIGGETMYSFAIAIYNTNDYNERVARLGLLLDLHLPKHRLGYVLTELFSNTFYGLMASNDHVTVRVNASSALLFRATIYELANLGQGQKALLNLTNRGNEPLFGWTHLLALCLVLLICFLLCRRRSRLFCCLRWTF